MYVSWRRIGEESKKGKKKSFFRKGREVFYIKL